MNIDRDLANRALGAVGEPSLAEGDTSSKAYKLIKKCYISTMLESLEAARWTSARTRKSLTRQVGENLTHFAFRYHLPLDCANIIGLDDKSYYIVEGRSLYTDCAAAVLVYITNGRVSGENVQADDDFPDYAPPVYEALFYRAFELRLASKIALELSGKEKLHQMLLQEAILFETAGYRNSKTMSAGKQNGKDWWV